MNLSDDNIFNDDGIGGSDHVGEIDNEDVGDGDTNLDITSCSLSWDGNTSLQIYINWKFQRILSKIMQECH